jgi:hypothetical protein
MQHLPPPPIIKCVDCTSNEKQTLDFLQKHRGITDRNALAVVMGNIKQESKFIPNICEGGARVSYNSCHYGGFGIIQWTTPKRYNGLGSFCNKYGCNPSTLTGQLRYMVNETQWQKFERKLKQPGYSVSYYMNHAYNWLGWGIHGNRTNYAYNYLNRFRLV